MKFGLLTNAVEKYGPPVLICLELQLPDTLGMSAVTAVKTKYPNAKLAVITGAYKAESRCLNAGANAFIEKSKSSTQIMAVLRSLLITEDEKAEEDSAPAGPIRLSKRQKQLVLLLDQGLSNREIAGRLDISEHTVKVHLWRLFRKIGAHNRTQALHIARTNGWL